MKKINDVIEICKLLLALAIRKICQKTCIVFLEKIFMTLVRFKKNFVIYFLSRIKCYTRIDLDNRSTFFLVCSTIETILHNLHTYRAIPG